jgi:hypothetical protein
MSAPALEHVTQEEDAIVANSIGSEYFDSLENYSSYSDLVRKMSKISDAPKHVNYEFTEDAGLLHQYCILREEMFKKVWDLSHFKAQKDSIDDISTIMVARQGKHCVGGGRITFSTPHKRQKLPMESEQFTIEHALKSFKLEECSYAEVTRIAVLSEFSKDNVLVEMVGRIITKIIDEGCHYLFFISPMSMTRNHRRVVTQLDYHLVTDKSVVIPDREEYEGIQMFLSYIDLRPFLNSSSAKDSKSVLSLA